MSGAFNRLHAYGVLWLAMAVARMFLGGLVATIDTDVFMVCCVVCWVGGELVFEIRKARGAPEAVGRTDALAAGRTERGENT